MDTKDPLSKIKNLLETMSRIYEKPYRREDLDTGAKEILKTLGPDELGPAIRAAMDKSPTFKPKILEIIAEGKKIKKLLNKTEDIDCNKCARTGVIFVPNENNIGGLMYRCPCLNGTNKVPNYSIFKG